MKRLVIALLVVAVLVGGGYLALRTYLRSDRVTGQVTQKLEAIYGGPVKVAAVEVGVTGSSLSDFELYEKGQDAAPWLKVGSVQTDITFLDLIKGAATPHNVTIRDAV